MTNYVESDWLKNYPESAPSPSTAATTAPAQSLGDLAQAVRRGLPTMMALRRQWPAGSVVYDSPVDIPVPGTLMTFSGAHSALSQLVKEAADLQAKLDSLRELQAQVRTNQRLEELSASLARIEAQNEQRSLLITPEGGLSGSGVISLEDLDRARSLMSGAATAAEAAAFEESGVAPPWARFFILMQSAALSDEKREEHGPCPTAEFACCRILEEAGELVQAATSVTRGRDEDRGPRIEKEAIDLIAMVLTLLREFPEGRGDFGGAE